MLGLVLKVVFPGFVFFIPGYVEISSIIEPLKHAVIAFAGPGMNLILWLGSAYLLKRNKTKTQTNHQSKNLKGKWLLILHMTKRINMFLNIGLLWRNILGVILILKKSSTILIIIPQIIELKI